MRAFLVIIVIFFVALGAFAYVRDPGDCLQIVHDLGDLYKSMASEHVKSEIVKTALNPSSAVSSTASSSSTPSAALASSVAIPIPISTEAIKTWSPPTVLPQQPNWTWTTTDGKTYQQVRIVKVEADAVTILNADGGALIPIATLPPDIQKQLNYQPEAAREATVIRQRNDQQVAAERAQEDSPARASAATQAQRPTLPLVSGVADSSQAKALVGASLMGADGSDWNFPARGPGVQYLAIYFSAHWCPPCRAFTPQLVQWYNGFKPKHPNFELIFMSDDHDENAMSEYMKTMAMPWPAVRYGERGLSGLGKFANSGIPDLVLIDSSGKVLSDSFQGSTYLGPQHVLEDIQKQLGD